MIRLCFCVAVIVLLMTGCHGKAVNAPEKPLEQEQVEISDLTAEAREWADSVCAAMTLRQKVAQLFLPAVYASDDYWTLRQIREYADGCVGGIVLLKGDSQSASVVADSMRSGSRIEPFVAIDAEWGLAMRLVDAPQFPANNVISPGVDDRLMYDYGHELARECRLLGINMVLGPVVDVSVPGGFMNRRSFGGDPVRVSDLAVAYARGLEDGDVISVAKHFPGHGSVTADSHRRKGVIERSLNEMDSVDLYPFRRWIEQRLSGVMVGHLAVPSIDSEMLPAAVSRTVITDLLRNDLGFSGLVLTDALNMKGAEGYGAVDAIMAGADIVIAPVNTFDEIQSLVMAVEEGKLSLQSLDTHVRRILFYKYLLSGSGGAGLHPDAAGSLDSPEADTISRLLVADD